MLKMMIVEDERMEREGLINFIDWNSFGIHTVQAACDGIEGLELAKNLLPDIIITDIKMPGMNGLEMSKNIKKFLPNVKIIVLTGYDDFTFVKQAIGFRATDYVLKPVEKEEMIKAIKKASSECNLEQERLQRENEMKHAIEENFESSKSRFFIDLIQGNLQEEDIYKYCQKFNIDIHSNALVTILDYNTNEDQQSKDINKETKAIECEVEDFFHANRNNNIYSDSFVFVNNQDGYIISSLYGLNGDEVFLGSLYTELIEKLKNKHNIDLLISIGSMANNAFSINKSYSSAKEALEFIKYWSTSNLVFYKDINTLRIEANEKISDFILKGSAHAKNLIIAMSSSEHVKFSILLEEMFSFIRSYKGLDKEYVTNYIYSIINEASLFIYNVNKQTETFMEKYQDCGRQFMNKKSLKAMEDYVYEFFNEVLMFLNEKRSNKDDNVVKKVVKLIEQKYMEEISLKTIASEVYLSPNYLGNLFKKTIGKTFNEYLCEYRMTKAKELLEHSNKKISTVAQEVGIPNTSYFCILFKNAYGVAPGEYQDMVLRW